MSTLITRFNNTSLATSARPFTPALDHSPQSGEESIDEVLVRTRCSTLTKAAREGPESFNRALSSFRAYYEYDPSQQFVLEKLFRRMCCEGRVWAAQKLLELGVNIDAVDLLGFNALGCAVSQCRSEVVRFLIEHGASTRHVGSEVMNVLHYAYQKGLRDLIPNILQLGVTIDAEDSHGRTLLMSAAKDGELEIAKTLLERGASVDCLPPRASSYALGYAAAWGHLEMSKLLLDHNAPIDQRDHLGKTALMIACSEGRSHINVIGLLLKRGANTTLLDRYGRLAINWIKDSAR